MTKYNVTGMSCAACQARVEKAVSAVPGVDSCAVSLLTNSMGVEGDADPGTIIKAVEDAGYGASLKEHEDKEQSGSVSYENELKDNIFNEVEKFNAKNILKGDLADIYKEIVKDNMDFKENIFFVNLNHYENMIGNCDDKKISHTFKEYKKEELLKNQYLPTKELYNKYDRKAKIIQKQKDF